MKGWITAAIEKQPCLLVLDGLDTIIRPDMEVSLLADRTDASRSSF
jgi:hypothetical protein